MKRLTKRRRLRIHLMTESQKPTKRFSNFRTKMSLLKSVLGKLASFRFGLGGSAPESGDYCYNDRKVEEIDWNAVSHPSRDPYGIPINAYEYYYRRRRGQMGFSAPPLTIDGEDLIDDQDENQQPNFTSPRKIPFPSFSQLRLTLPPETHRFLAKNAVKDCRTWLWKNETGRQARMQLGQLALQQRLEYQQQQIKAQGQRVNNQKFTFSRGQVRQVLAERSVTAAM